MTTPIARTDPPHAELPYATRDEARKGRFFDARGPVAQQILRSRSPTILIHGGLGSGKTRACLEKLRGCAIKYPGCRILLARSVRKWLTTSALVSWEDEVLEPGLLVADRIHRSSRSEYAFKNGTIVVVAGLDDPVAVRSAQYDIAFVVEATENDQNTIEEISGRLRNGVMPYQQLLMDCNPSAPTHWLRKEIDANRLESIKSNLRDNPAYCDPVTGEWTSAGKRYDDRLQKTLTGSRYDRLYRGEWVQSEGVVYNEWSSDVHVIAPFKIPDSWDRYVVIDFGYNAPMVVQWVARDPENKLYLYREIFQTNRLVEDIAGWAKREIQKVGEPWPREVIGDHDREGRATWEKYFGMPVTPAEKTIDAGIQDVKERLRPVDNPDKPKLFVFRLARCHEMDEHLKEYSKPGSTEAEFDGYIWDTKLKKGEAPLKENDHGMDCIRYICRHLRDRPAVQTGPTHAAPKKPLSVLPRDVFRR